ncbi:MAG: hypothetical protein HFH33_12985 [Eubacterium sp.]|jgi:hypothetical protein|nr:hypothetical protein [Eubacterium sp.]
MVQNKLGMVCFYLKNKKTNAEAVTKEEHCVKETYEYFKSQRNETKLKDMLKRKHGSEIVESLLEVF